MKKLICLALCLAMVCCLLVGCADDEIGADLDKLKDKVNIEVVEEIELDFYVVVGEGTKQNAMSTVELMINQYLEKFKTTLDIHYLTAAEYRAKMLNDIKLEGDERADIVLVTDKALFDELYSERLIANVASYFDPVASPYRSLNTQICSALLSATTVPETQINASGISYVAQNRYCVPNNRIVGEYEIFLVSIAAADYYNIGQDTFNSLTKEEVTARIYEKIDADTNSTFTRENAVISTTGNYAELEDYINGGEYYVKYSVPAISEEEAYAGAFAIARHKLDIRHEKGWEDKVTGEQIATYTKYYDRCMQIIYELNTSVELRNLLQYGKVNTNYKLDPETNSVTHDNIAEDDIYLMDLRYTGDVFKAYFCNCDKHSWTKEDAAYGERQNKDAIVAPAVDTPDN